MRWFGRIHCHRARNSSPPSFRREAPLQKNCVRIGFSISCATIKHYNSEKSRASDAFSIVSNHTMSMWITTDTRIFCPLSLSFPHTHTYTRTFQTYFINDKSFSSEKHSNNNIEWAKEKKIYLRRIMAIIGYSIENFQLQTTKWMVEENIDCCRFTKIKIGVASYLLAFSRPIAR